MTGRSTRLVNWHDLAVVDMKVPLTIEKHPNVQFVSIFCKFFKFSSLFSITVILYLNDIIKQLSSLRDVKYT